MVGGHEQGLTQPGPGLVGQIPVAAWAHPAPAA